MVVWKVFYLFEPDGKLGGLLTCWIYLFVLGSEREYIHPCSPLVSFSNETNIAHPSEGRKCFYLTLIFVSPRNDPGCFWQTHNKWEIPLPMKCLFGNLRGSKYIALSISSNIVSLNFRKFPLPAIDFQLVPLAKQVSGRVSYVSSPYYTNGWPHPLLAWTVHSTLAKKPSSATCAPGEGAGRSAGDIYIYTMYKYRYTCMWICICMHQGTHNLHFQGFMTNTFWN